MTERTSITQLLQQGGDARLILDRAGVNQYGCPPCPDPVRLAFGSSTASVISPYAFTAAERLGQRLQGAGGNAAAIHARERDRQRQQLADLCGLSPDAGVDIIFAASGTDVHLIAGQLVLAGCDPAPLVIMMEGSETGSGVANALAGRHFSNCTALGASVVAGEAIGTPILEVATVRLREADGRPRPLAAIDAEVARLAGTAVRAGRRVLLVLIDQSKTGLIAPGPCLASELRQKYEQVDVLVDACQFRLAPATLQAYLAQGFLVALTGSKFLTGPAFSGALLIPASPGLRLRQHPLTPALRMYSSRPEWPVNWPTASLPETANFGLLLRWEAALTELERFRRVPESRTEALLRELADALQMRLADAPYFAPLEVLPLDRGPFTAAHTWDTVPTIFPFLLCKKGQPLSREATATVYQRLLQDVSGPETSPETRALLSLRCQLGQPVACGHPSGQPVSALRLCISARQVVEAASGTSQAVIAQVQSVLDKAALLVAQLPD